MFWKTFVELCTENETTPSRVVSALGIAAGSITKWKNGTIPNSVTLHKLASYFNVTEDYFLNQDNNTFLNEQLSGVDFALYGEVKEMTEEEKQDVLDYIRYKKLKKKNS